MKNAYELREIALALMGGGWTAADKELFIEENAKQETENILAMNEIDAIFDEIASEEGKAESMIVTNSYGVKIDFNAAIALMDDEIREAIHNDLAPCSEQEFFNAYCAAHAAEFGELWELDKRNPVY